MIPAQIGRYLIKNELGRGGMATVYFAHDPRFKRDVAIKVLPAQFLGDPIFRTRFEREAQMIAALEHPAIVPVYDFGEEGDELYLVMRYMPGGSLSDRLRSGHLSLAESAAILSRLAPALDQVHSKGLVHRDLKPANILFDAFGNAYLSDFGIARAAQGASTLTGDAIIGTPAYMSPEQALGDPNIDSRSDIYSLGAILFEMLAGKQPYQATTPMGVAMKHITEPAPRIREVKTDLHPGCEEIILRAMAKERDRRYTSASEMARALEALAAAQDRAAPPAAAQPEQPSPAAPAAALEAPTEWEVETPHPAPDPDEALQPAVPVPAPAGAPLSGSGLPAPASSAPSFPDLAQPAPGGEAQARQTAARRRVPPWALASGCVVLAALCGLSLFALSRLGPRLNLFGQNGSPSLTASATGALAQADATETTAGPAQTPAGPGTTPTVSTRPEVISTLRVIQPTGSGNILFQDDFSDPESGWERDTGANLSADYYHGSYRILVNEPYYIVWGLLNLIVKDVIIDVEVTKASGPPEDFFGIICRYQDKDNYYFLNIASDSWYLIGKMKDGQELLLGEAGSSNAVHQGNTSNRVRAECVGDTLSLFANNTRLLQVSDPDFSEGAIGLMGRTFGTPGTNLLFDNLRVMRP